MIDVQDYSIDLENVHRTVHQSVHQQLINELHRRSVEYVAIKLTATTSM